MNGRSVALRLFGLVFAAAIGAAILTVVPPPARLPFALLALPLELVLFAAVVPPANRHGARSQ